MAKENKKWNSLVEMFFDQAERFNKKPFLAARENGDFVTRSWEETAGQVASLARALTDMGIKKGDRVALLSENRLEWAIADLAIMAAGAVTVPLYTTYTASDHLHVLENSGARAAIVSTKKLAKQFLPAAHESDALKSAIFIETPKISQELNVKFFTWDKVLEKHKTGPAEIRKDIDQFSRDDKACIIYTSGTGGAPKGVILHHGSILHNCEGAIEVLRDFGLKNNRFLSFLPLSHAYGHMGDLYLPISIGAEIYFVQSLDKLTRDMGDARPTVMLVVPRLFEMIKGRIEAGIRKGGPAKQKLLEKTIELGLKKKNDPKSLNFLENTENRCLDVLVRRKVKKTFGGRLKALVSGGAALNPEVGAFFQALGLNLLQGYGQTETGPLISVNRPPNIRIDTVGPPVKNTKVKIAKDGEILVRGELVMQGYWLDPEGTAETIRDGWLHTGDVGHFDKDGHLKITDRKKDIIVFDKGDNVSPQRVEGLLTLEPEIAQAMVFGDGKPHLVGLIVPDEGWLKAWADENGKTANLSEIFQDRDLKSALGEAVSRVNKKLSSLERVRRIAVMKEPFTIENSMMTPTLKIRRHVITRKFRDVIDGLY